VPATFFSRRFDEFFGFKMMSQLLFLALFPIVALGFKGSEASSPKEIHLAGMFPINGNEGWQGGQACEPAAKLALEDVNKKNDVLPGYTLRLQWDDSECDAGKGAAVMYDLLYNQPQKVILLAGCSTVCTTVAEAAKMWNLVTVCYGASSPALSNRKRFPTLFRTHPSATVHNPTRISLMKQFKWTKIAILQEAEEVFSTTLDDLEARTKLADITISTRQIFTKSPSAAVANLKRQDARIIVGLFYAKAARKVLCEIYKQKLFGPKYVWFFIGWYEDDWYQKHLKEENINCTQPQMEEAAEGHFTTEAQQWNQDEQTPTVSGQTVDEFRKRLNTVLREKYEGVAQNIMPEGYLEAPLAYDAIWAVALALNRTMARLVSNGTSLEDYNYENQAIADIIKNEIGDVQFMGMSGSVAFSEETGDRMAWTKIEQMQSNKYSVIAFYDQKSDNLTWKSETGTDSEVVWPGGKIPQDRTIVINQLLMVNLWLYLSMAFVAIFGILIAISLVYFNFRYGHRRIIQHSHPSCNNLMLMGISLCLLAIIPVGLDGRFVSPGAFPVACGTGTWLLTLGHSLAFGAMFSKIWRVHRLTTKNKSDSKIRNVVPWKLWAAVGGLLAIDLILLITWSIVDPLRRQVHNFAKIESDDPEDDIEIQPQLEHCKSTHHTVWLGIMYAYKGLQLVLGLFLAYETRSVKLKQINDSRLVGMAIYNVVILCMITAPVILVIGNQQNAAFCFVSLANVFCCYLSMALVFIPKIIFIRAHAHDPREKEDDERDVAEQELRLRELLKANEELQRKVAERQEKMAILKAALEAQKKDTQLQINQQPEIGMAAVAEIDSSFNNNVEAKHVAPNGHEVGLRNRRNGEATTNGHGETTNNTVAQSAVTDLERTTSLRGITVLRSQGQNARPPDEHVESYL